MSPLTFGKEILFRLDALKDESPTIGYISLLNWNWRAHDRADFYVKLYLSRSNYFGTKGWFCYSAGIEINISFRERNLHIFQSPTVKLKLEVWEIGFTVFLNVHGKITILIPKTFLTCGAPACKFSIESHCSFWIEKVVHFQAAICLVKNQSLHWVASSYRLWYTLKKLENLSLMWTWDFIDVQYSLIENHCIKHARIRVFTEQFCPYMGEYGSVKTHIFACFMQWARGVLNNLMCVVCFCKNFQF